MSTMRRALAALAVAATVPLFVNAASAIFSLEGALDAQSTLTREVRVEGIDREALMVNWLNELLFLQETQLETYQKFAIDEFSDTGLTATIQGAIVPPRTKFIKAVTFHNLKITETDEGWETTIVVDV